MIPKTIAQACGMDLWTNGDVWNATWCVLTQPSGAGWSGVSLLVAFGGFVSLYNWSEGFTMPATWLAIMSGIAIMMLPGTTAKVVLSTVVIAVMIGLYGLWRAA